MQQSFEARNKAVEFSVLCQTGSNLGNNLRELKAAKRKLLGEFVGHCNGDKSKAKTRLRLYNKRKEEEDADADVVSIGEDSVESTLEKLKDLEMDIATTKNDIATVQDGKAKSKKALCSEAGRSK